MRQLSRVLVASLGMLVGLGACSDDDSDAAGGSSGGAGGHAGTGGTGGTGGSGVGGDAGGGGGSAGGGGTGGSSTCVPLSLEPSATYGSVLIGDGGSEGVHWREIYPGLEQLPPDRLVLERYDSVVGPATASGSFALGELSGVNANYSTCGQCVLIRTDFGFAGKTFFASSGTISIDPAPAFESGYLSATLSGVEFV